MQRTQRLFVQEPLAAGALVALTPSQAHYLRAVMRRPAGDVVRLFNGADGEWQARITRLDGRAGECVVEQQVTAQLAGPDLWLAFALLKRDAAEWVVQKATELGVAALLPVAAARSVPGKINAARLGAIAIEASEQCERLTIPEIRPVQTLPALLGNWPGNRTLYAAIERSGAPHPGCSRVPAGLLVGPEGGFDPDERALLLRCPAVSAVSLGPLVLRAETAVVVGLALLQFSAKA